MNILFIGKRYVDDFSSGVEKKLSYQIKALENLGHSVFYTGYEDDSIYLYEKDRKTKLITVKNFENPIFQIYSSDVSMRRAYLKIKDKIDICYFRKTLANPLLLSNFKKMKKNGVKIITEIPTFPYDLEFKSKKALKYELWLLCDKIFRKNLYKYVNHFVTYSKDNEIWNVKAISISNGTSIEDVEKYIAPKHNNEIHLLAVAHLSFWHGYDRVIKGLADYYNNFKDNNTKVYFHIVGDGEEKESLEKLTKNLKLDNFITFYGKKSSNELVRIFNKCNIAVSSLALYRKNLIVASELKTREYIARGIPFIYSAKDTSLDKEYSWALKIDNNDSNIDILKIISFYKNLENNINVGEEMRNFAKENLTWDKQMQKALGDTIK